MVIAQVDQVVKVLVVDHLLLAVDHLLLAAKVVEAAAIHRADQAARVAETAEAECQER